MGNSASRQVDNFIERFLNTNKDLRKKQIDELYEDFKHVTNIELDEVREYGPIKAFRFLHKHYDAIQYYQIKRKQEYVKSFYNEDGSEKKELIEKEIEKRKQLYPTYSKYTYEQLVDSNYMKYGEFTRNDELSELFDYMNTDRLWIEVATDIDGRHKLMMHMWSVEAFDKFEFMHNGMENIIFNETIWPNDEIIRNENRQIKNKLIKKWKSDMEELVEKGDDWSFSKKGEINPFRSLMQFEYVFGSPKYIEYFMKKLPDEVQKKYNGDTWINSIQMFYMTGDNSHTFLIPEFKNIKVEWEM